MTTGRIVHPTMEERRKWTLFVAAARDHAEALINWRDAIRGAATKAEARRAPTADKFGLARRRMRNCRLPENQQTASSAMMRLIQMADAWPTFDLAQRLGRVEALSAIAAIVADEITPKADPRPERRPRADIDG